MITTRFMFCIMLGSALLSNRSLADSHDENGEFSPFNYLELHMGQHDLQRWPAEIGMGNDINFTGLALLQANKSYGIQVGREYEHSRYDIEWQEGHYRIHEIQLGVRSQSIDHKGKFSALTVNAYRTKHFNNRYDGFLGAGLGWGSAEMPAMAFTGGCHCFARAENDGLLWQARIGLERRFGEQFHVGLKYTRIFGLSGPASGDILPAVVYPDRNVGIWSLSLRRDFQHRRK